MRMHGQKRLTKEARYSQQRLEQRKRKAKLYAELSAACLERRREGRRDEESLALIAKLLEMNCEVYTLWNYRKEHLEPILKLEGDDGNDEARAVEAAEKELALLEACLQRNPKSYCCWQHRKWVVELHTALPSSAHDASLLDREVGLCDLLLTADERNFHCWSYRRFVCSLHRGKEPESELDYTAEKIAQNFSNYSAWHYRSALLKECNKTTTLRDLEGGGDVAYKRVLPPHVLDEEFALVKEAFYTEPEDQSAWLYHAWLVGHVAETRTTEEVDERIGAEVATMEEVLEVEPGSKWPQLCLARLLSMPTSREDKGRAKELYSALAGEDPKRAGYYRDAMAALDR